MDFSFFRKINFPQIFAIGMLLQLTDVLSTWVIVCGYNGSELNPTVVFLVRQFGYLPTSIITLGGFFLIVTSVYFALKKLKMTSTFIKIGIALIMILIPSIVVANNLSILFNMFADGIQPLSVMTPYQISFCRIF
jgi:hypothetical protein